MRKYLTGAALDLNLTRAAVGAAQRNEPAAFEFFLVADDGQSRHRVMASSVDGDTVTLRLLGGDMVTRPANRAFAVDVETRSPLRGGDERD